MSLKNQLFKTAGILLITLFLSVPGFTAVDNSPPSSPVKLVFIHHSTGGNWLADANSEQPYGELGKALMNNNYYVSATNYGWGPDGIGDRTDIPNWPSWFTQSGSSAVLSALYSETGQNIEGYGSWTRLSTDPGGENTIVMFKSCFPNSDLYGSPSDGPASSLSDQFTVSNAKAVYNNLLTYFQTKTDKLFIVITAPPQTENGYTDDYQTAAERAANARAFNNWLVNDWLDGYAYDNVAVFDYYNVLTATDNHHRWKDNAVEHVTNTSYNFAAYPLDEWDSHPNSTGHQKATTEFVDLLNYYYNKWQAGSTGTSSDDVTFTNLSISPSGSPQAGTPVTVTANAHSSSGATVYYRFYYCANYGTSAYETTDWTMVQDYSTDNTYDYTFPAAGNYVVVVRAVTDPPSEPAALSIIGQAVSVDGVDSVNISSLTNDASSSARAGTPVTFTATASTASSDTVYYRFYYCANYGTSAYETTDWTMVRDYSTDNTYDYTFPAAGSYVVVVRAVTDPPNEPAALPIIGQAVSVLSASGITVTSTAFSEGGTIPDAYSCNGTDISPPLAFSGIPEGTQSIALICDDPDAGGTFTHWVLFNLPASTTALSENVPATDTLASGAIHGMNDFGYNAYGGPCPPSGTHRYYFTVYALDIELNLTAGATKSQVVSAMTGHILAQGQLMGRYTN